MIELKACVLLNDFEACAYAVPTLSTNNLLHLKGSDPICFSNFSKYMLVGPGTGYGISMIAKLFNEPVVLCSEGGHMAIPAFDQEQFEFECFMKKKLNLKTSEIISAEWCFCGRGIPMLYEFYLERSGEKLKAPIQGEEVFASIETSAVSMKCFQRFLQMLGTLLMCNCTVLLPDSGVVLSGNILSAVIKHVQSDMSDPETSYFFKGFYSNPCNKPFLKTLNLYFTSEPDLSLKGCLVGSS